MFESLEGEESRGEESSGKKVEGNGYPPPYLDVLKIK